MLYETLQRWSNYRDIFAWLYGVGTALLVLATVLFWNAASVDPQNVFNDMLAQSLTVQGVSSQVTESVQSTKLQQTVQYAVGSGNVAHGITVLTQGKTTIKTELVGNASQTYTRYLAIQTDQKTHSGTVLDARSVLGVWAVGQTSDVSANSSPLLTQAALGFGSPVGSIPVAIGNLSPAKRQALLKQIHESQVYQVNYAKVTKTNKNGHLLYAYDVKIQPIPYLNMLKTFARDVGIHDLDSLDANNYAGTGALALTLTVDAHARQLVEVSSTNGYKLTYGGYGIAPRVAMPTHPISSAELQKRLGNIEL